MESYAVALLIFCLVGIVLTALYTALSGDSFALHKRFGKIAFELRAQDRAGSSAEPLLPGTARSLVEWAVERLPAPKDSKAVERTVGMLVHAGFKHSDAMPIYRLVRPVAVVLGAMLGYVIALLIVGPGREMILIMIGAGVLGAHLPTYYVGSRARKRSRKIARELSDVLDLMVVCVEAGLGLAEAIKIVGEETERHGQTIGAELMLVSGEVSAGGSLGDALRNLAERTAVDEIRPLAATLIQSEQLGSQIGPTLQASSDALRTHRRLRAEEAAQKTTIKILFPLVLFVLPAMLLVILAPALVQVIRALKQ
jgi:tight adherence protein C